jgi:DNA primase
MSKRIPPHKIDEIYAAADVVEVLGDYLQLKKRGSNFFALSPFTNEKTPSFAISPSKNIWKDFSTGKGGNAVSFLMEAEGMTYVEALKYLAEKYHIALDLEESPEDIVREDHRESLYVVNEFAARYFHKTMLETPKGRDIALSYFKERGLLDATIASFQLGYCGDEWDAFSKEAVKQQYKEEFLLETGLVFKSDKDGRLLDRFRSRIMFPIHNHLGKVVGFGGRIMTQEKMAKYINSPESPIYHKSNVLYGLHQAKKAIRDEDRCILVEGYMDVISLAQAGVENVVASSGTALTVDQIRLIKRFTPNVLLIYDADRAGIAAALRGIDLLLDAEMNVRVLLLPTGEDPDSYVKANGKSGFEAYANERAQDFLDFKLDQLRIEYNFEDPQGKTQAIHEVAQTLGHLVDPVKMEVYLELASTKLGISVDVIKRSIQKAQADKARLESRQEGFRQKQAQPSLPLDGGAPEYYEIPIEAMIPQELIEEPESAQEIEVLRILINYHDFEIQFEEGNITVIEYYSQDLREMPFKSKKLESFRQRLLETIDRKGNVNIDALLIDENHNISHIASSLISIPEVISPGWEVFGIKAAVLDANIMDVVSSGYAYFLIHFLEGLSEEARAQVKDAESDEALMKYMQIKKILNNIYQERGTTIPPLKWKSHWPGGSN